MKIIALGHDAVEAGPEQFKPYLEEEAKRLWQLYQSGIIREIYFRADHPDAVLVLECDSVQEADRTLASLPLVRHGLISFDVIPLKAYPGFSRLFKN